MAQGQSYFTNFLRQPDNSPQDPITNNLDPRNPNYPYAGTFAALFLALGYNVRTKAATDYYVDPVAGNDAGTGSVSSPWKTLLHAMAVLTTLLDFFGQTITLHLLNNAAEPLITAPWLGAGELVFDMGGHTLSVVNARAIDINNASPGGPITLQAGTLAATATTDVNAGRAISVLCPAKVFVNGVTFGPCTGHQVAVFSAGAFVQFIADYAITGGGVDHIAAANSGLIFYQNRAGTFGRFNVTISGNPAFSSAFALATQSGVLGTGTPNWIGTISGAAGQYNLSSAGALNSGNRGVSLPGNPANNVNNGGFLS